MSGVVKRLTGRFRVGGGAEPPAGLVPADKAAARARREALDAADGAGGGPAGDGFGGGAGPGGGDGAGAVPQRPQVGELVAERERLTERFALLQSDLGGAFYEMAIRDHVRIEVLTRKAAELQRVDHALGAVERELRYLEAAR